MEPCDYCHTAKHLHVKQWSSVKMFCVSCDNCGQVGLSEGTRARAKESWNKQMKEGD